MKKIIIAEAHSSASVSGLIEGIVNVITNSCAYPTAKVKLSSHNPVYSSAPLQSKHRYNQQ